MCLYTKQKEPFIAKEDISCYKILQEENEQWITPYMGYSVKFNKTLEAEKCEEHKEIFGYYEISKGYFHVCTSKKSAQCIANNIKIGYSHAKKKCPKLVGFKAIIPKGSEYYIANDTICSNKLIILKE